MTVAADLAALDTAHRERQAANAEQVAKLVLAYWLLVDPADISGTGLQWLDRSTEAVLAGRSRSADLASAYNLGVQRLTRPGAADVAPVSPVANLEQIRASLTYTGLTGAALKTQAARRVASLTDQSTAQQRRVSYAIAEIYRRQREQASGSLSDPQRIAERALDRTIRIAMESAGAAAGAAAVRHVQDAGRSVTDEVVRADPLAIGYVRITRPGCCHWCAMLASRGPVYKADSFRESDARFEGPGEHKVHDDCGCTMRPVYTRDPFEWPDLSREFESLWQSSTKGKSGKDAVLAFRKAYERSALSAA